MSTFKESLGYSCHIYFRSISTYKEKTNEETHPMSFLQEFKLFIR